MCRVSVCVPYTGYWEVAFCREYNVIFLPTVFIPPVTPWKLYVWLGSR